MLKEGLKVNLSLNAEDLTKKKIEDGRERKTSSWLNWFSSVNTTETQVWIPLCPRLIVLTKVNGACVFKEGVTGFNFRLRF